MWLIAGFTGFQLGSMSFGYEQILKRKKKDMAVKQALNDGGRSKVISWLLK